MPIGLIIVYVVSVIGFTVGIGIVLWGLFSANWRLVMRGAGVVLATILATTLLSFLVLFL